MSAAFASPTRAIPHFRASGAVFAPSALDRALGDYRAAFDAVPGYDYLFQQAYAELDRANKVRPEYRQDRVTSALAAIEVLGVRRRAAVERRDAAASALSALGGDPEEYAAQMTAHIVGGSA